jgi:putative protease
MNFKQLKDTIRKTHVKTIITTYGRTKLMVNRNCITGSSIGKGDGSCISFCRGKIHYLKDKMGEEFPVITDTHCRSIVYNSKILCIIDNMKDIINLNADYIKLDFVDEEPEAAGLVVKAFEEGLKNAAEGDYKISEYGEILREKLKGSMTKGHFLRGVD